MRRSEEEGGGIRACPQLNFRSGAICNSNHFGVGPEGLGERLTEALRVTAEEKFGDISYGLGLVHQPPKALPRALRTAQAGI